MPHDLESTNGQKWKQIQDQTMIGDELKAYSNILSSSICSDLCVLEPLCVSFTYKGSDCSLKDRLLAGSTQPPSAEIGTSYFEKMENQFTNLYSFKLVNKSFVGTIKFFIYFELQGGTYFISPELTLITFCNISPPQILPPT